MAVSPTIGPPRRAATTTKSENALFRDGDAGEILVRAILSDSHDPQGLVAVEMLPSIARNPGGAKRQIREKILSAC